MALTGKRLLLCVLTLVALMASATAVWFHDWPIHHFAIVEEGVLYRGGQPDEAGWKYLRDRCNIRTVIDLREEKPKEPWAVLERTFCAENDIRYIKLPVGPDRLTDRELRIIVEAIRDPKSQPVFIHCELGSSRTGIAVAAYRVVAQGWSYDAALAESQKFKNHMEPGYAAYLKQLAGGEGWRPGAKPHSIGRARRWLYDTERVSLTAVAEALDASADCRR